MMNVIIAPPTVQPGGAASAGGEPMCPQMNESVTSLIQAVESHDHLTPSLCKRLLSESTITAEDLMPWADFDHPQADSYGRRLVHEGGHFELMVMSWVDGDMAAIHDHGYTQWGAVKLFGPAEHAIFKLQDSTLSTAERKVFNSGDVVAVGHDFIHQMGNVGQSPYLTLHLYGCYERDCDVTADANLYDLEEGSVRITSGGVFFDLPEDCVSRRVEGPRADFPTALRDRVELLQRMMRAHDSLAQGALQSDRERKVAAWLFDADTWQAATAELQGRSKNGHLSDVETERYQHILRQELRAAARLQYRLVEAGMGQGPLQDQAEALTNLLAADNLDAFAEGYLELLGNAFGLTFPVAQVA